MKCPQICKNCPLFQENRKLKKLISLMESKDDEAAELLRLQRQLNSVHSKLKTTEKKLKDTEDELEEVKNDFTEAVKDAEKEAEKKADVAIANCSVQHKKDIHICKEKYEGIISDLKDKEQKTKEELVKKDEELTKTKIELEKAKSSLNKDSHNSGKPTSKDGYKTVVHNSRPSTDKKAGGQIGHAPSNLNYLTPDTTHILSDDDFAQNPDRYKSTGRFSRKQRVGMKISFYVEEYAAPIYYDQQEKKYVHPDFPDDLVNRVNYDGSIPAFAMLLHTFGDMSYDKVRQVFSDLSDGRIHPSKAWMTQLEKRFQLKTIDERREITEAILNSPFANADFTTTKVNGENMCVLTVTTPFGTMYYFSEHKGFQSTEFSLLPEYTGVLIHDGEKVLFHYGSDHQLCIVHELRYLLGAAETETDITWLKPMHDLLQKADHLANEARRKQETKLSEEAIHSICSEYDRLIALGKREYQEKGNGYYDQGKQILKRLDTYRDFYLNFLTNLSLPAVNNAAESALRFIKLHFSNGSQARSEEGALAYTDTWSVLQSRKQKGESIYTAIKNVFNPVDHATAVAS